ncbi:MAG: hypothetical protein ACRD0A_05630 [Acidimicrobiales bacterium]
MTFEFYNAPVGGVAQPDTLLSGTEMLAYDRDAILVDLWTRLGPIAEAEEQYRWGARSWDMLPDDVRQQHLEAKRNELYEPYPLMVQRTLRTEARKIITSTDTRRHHYDS